MRPEASTATEERSEAHAQFSLKDLESARAPEMTRIRWRERWAIAWRGLSFGLFWRALVHAVMEEDLFDLAAQTAYWNLLAVFPFALVVLSLLSFVPVQGLDVRLVGFLFTAMPHDAAKLITTVLADVVGKQRGWMLVASLIGAWWTAAGGVSSIMASMNEALGVDETRSFWKTKGIALGVIAGGSLLVLAGIAALAFGSEVGMRIVDAANLGNPMSWVYDVIRWTVLLVAIVALSGLSYWLLPNASRRGRFIVPGMIVATLVWAMVSFGFAAYVGQFATYSRTYGALGAAIVLMTWLYLFGLVLLLGGLVNAVFDRAYHDAIGKIQRRRRWR